MPLVEAPRFDLDDGLFDNRFGMQEDNIIEKLIEHDELLKQIVTKAELADFRLEQTVVNDEMLTILKRIDEERYATIEWIRRIEQVVEVHERQIQEIKTSLNFST